MCDIQVNDLVLCVDASLPEPLDPLHLEVNGRIQVGILYRVSAVTYLRGEKGLELHGVSHRPLRGWRATRFRKVQEHREMAMLKRMGFVETPPG